MQKQFSNINSTTHFDPGIKYYFLSVLIGNSQLPKWYRKPFMTKEMVLDYFMTDILPNSDDVLNIEIFKEETLKEMIYFKGIDNEYYETNLREFLFGKKYSSEDDYYSKITTPGAEFVWRKTI